MSPPRRSSAVVLRAAASRARRTAEHGVRRVVSAPERRRALRRLRERPDAAAVLAAVDGRGDAREGHWVERIEDVRRRYLASEEKLTVHARDYSGDPDDERTLTHVIGELTRSGSRPPHWSLMLLRLVRALRPALALELGTLVGVSGAYQAAGLELAGGGRLVTMDASGERIAIARTTWAEVGLAHRVEAVQGRFQETLAPTLERLGQVQYAFVDGHHDEEATVRYTDAILARMSDGGHVVLDDIRWSEGMTRAWRALTAHPAAGLAIDLGDMGVLVRGGRPELVRLPLH